MKKHHMKLAETPYRMIERGEKTCEARLYDEKRQQIDLGDMIVFSRVDNKSQTMETEVVGLLRYETFGDMFARTDPSKFGIENAELGAEVMLQYYDQQQQDKYGVLGIELELVR
jgi:ASC-1-like (ASCH) protein